MTDTPTDFAERLNALIELKRKPDGSKYSQEEIVQGVGGVLSRAYLWKLRTGRSKNPGFHVVQALADFFEVDINYFTVEEDLGAKMIDQARADELVDQIALRSSMLGHEAKLAVLNMIDFILKNRAETEHSGDIIGGAEVESGENPEGTPL